jgi:quercetin dioxygenase-like cupin family protein
MIDQEQISRDWGSRGFSCSLWVDPPGRGWEDFVHDVDELVLLLEGELELEIDGALHHLSAGDQLFIPAGARHSVKNIGAGTARWLFGYRRSLYP